MRLTPRVSGRLLPLPLGVAVLTAIAVLPSACAPRAGSTAARPPDPGRIVFRDPATGRRLTAADLEGVTGTVRYEIIGADKVTLRAMELHQQAREAGGTGNYAKALVLLSAAQKEAPGWPYPVYDAAYTRLLMGDDGAALKGYRDVVRMSPRGFFTAITAADSLGREKAGTLPRGTYKRYLLLELVEDPAARRAELES